MKKFNKNVGVIERKTRIYNYMIKKFGLKSKKFFNIKISKTKHLLNIPETLLTCNVKLCFLV